MPKTAPKQNRKGDNEFAPAELRKKSGLSIGALAKKIDVSASRLSQIEKRKKLPGQDVVIALADGLQVSPNRLLRWPGVVSAEEVFHYYASIQGYSIESITKFVDIELSGDATITQEVIGLRCHSDYSVNVTHSVVAGPPRFGGPPPGDLRRRRKGELLKGVSFDWLHSKMGGERAIPAPSLSVDRDKPSSGRLIVQALPNHVYSYRFKYRIVNSYSMTEEETQSTDRQGLEASSFYTTRPIRLLRMTLLFPKFYTPIRPASAVWKGDSLYSPQIEEVTERVKNQVEFATAPSSEHPGRLTATLGTLFPTNGCSYGIVWRPIVNERYIALGRVKSGTGSS